MPPSVVRLHATACDGMVAVLSVYCELVSTGRTWVFEGRSLARDLPPFSERRGAALLEGLTIDEVSFEVEVVVDVGVN